MRPPICDKTAPPHLENPGSATGVGDAMSKKEEKNKDHALLDLTCVKNLCTFSFHWYFTNKPTAELQSCLTQTHRSQSRLNRDRYVIKTCQPAKTHVQYSEGKHPCYVYLHTCLYYMYTYWNVPCVANWDIPWHSNDHVTWWLTDPVLQLRCLLPRSGCTCRLMTCKYQNCENNTVRHFKTIEV